MFQNEESAKSRFKKGYFLSENIPKLKILLQNPHK